MRFLRPSLRIVLGCVVFALTAPAQVERQTVRIPSEDGIELATEIYHPGTEPAPVVLVRTPYGRAQLDYLAAPLAEAGYVVAVQDVRGRYDSSGPHEPFRHERVDGLASLAWLVEQPWCDGKIGMWGSSYSGYAALSVADAELPEFQSIFAISGWLDAEQVVRPGGANHLMLNLAWMVTQQGRTQRSLQGFDIDAMFRHLPMRDALRSAGIRNETWEDPAWMDEGAHIELGEIRRPVFQLTGWHDMVYRATLDAWRRVGAQAGQPHKLVLGPWYHNQFLFDSWQIGDADFGRVSGLGRDEMIALAVQWFDATLRDADNGMLERAPVTYFAMEQNAWHEADAWPPRDVELRRWYLTSGGNARTASGDGGLVDRRPERAAQDTFSFDPNDPVPTTGGANFFYFPDLVGVRDQREVEARDDVLVYTTPPLADELHIAGRVRAHLRVATTGADTDFTAKLVVVRPDGYARIVEDGITRVSAQLADLPDPGTPFDVEIELGHTALAVSAGERLRLEVSSSNFPKYDRNPNSGEDAFLAESLVPATQTVFHGGAEASWLELPVRVQQSSVADAQRQPVVRPAEVAAAEAEAVGGDARSLVAEGRKKLEAGQAEAALVALERAVELEPEVPTHHYWLARANLVRLNEVSMFQKLGFAKKVQQTFARAIELDPDYVDARVGLANFYFNAPQIAGGSVDLGLAQAEEIRKRDPLQGYTLIAQAHQQRGAVDEAMRAYREAIAAAPTAAAPRVRLGLLLQQQKAWDEAFAVFEQGVADLGDASCLYQLGRTAVLSGQRLDRGAEAFARYIAEGTGGQVPHAHWRLGMLHELRGETDKARAAYRAALELEPGLEQAKEALAALR